MDGLKTIVDRFYASVEQLLTSQWLLNDQEIVSGEEGIITSMCSHVLAHVQIFFRTAEQRRAELDRLRSIYIPELVFSLHRCLMDSKDYLPRYASYLQILFPLLTAPQRGRESTRAGQHRCKCW